ncbi:diacylglycerol O-acyltransferase 3, cytosolic-like [Chenopodium quinoa]|uniref:diacylglycerol O-acyltransferase 3, cytosolic-like n=1 Tax=Chenopodium quinoa TaxID=63459 RepID=UPI000B785EF5|nr:diacylglycerol O-acyltransferase 3, cytosolic-like [Chenopodium quinoa]
MAVLNGVVFKSSSCCYTTQIGKVSGNSRNSCFLNSEVCFRRGNRTPSLRELKLKVGNHGFEDEGHLDYYNSGVGVGVSVSPVCGGKKGKGKKGWNGIPVKKRMKLLKGLVKDLSTFSELGFGLNLDSDNNLGFAVDDDKSRTISQAAETLLAQLKLLKAEEEKMKNCESSSSSSESSDSECDEVIDMKTMKNKTVVRPIETKEIHSVIEEPQTTTPTTLLAQSMSEQLPLNSEQKCSNMILDLTLNKDVGIEVLDSETLKLHQPRVESIGKKIEVCMGGKCKKLGAPALMEEFQRAVGSEGVVEGCKCMGKCKSAPNVRLQNGNVGADSVKTSNPLYIGVGLEDVELIVANYFEEEAKDQLRFAVAAVSS